MSEFTVLFVLSLWFTIIAQKGLWCAFNPQHTFPTLVTRNPLVCFWFHGFSRWCNLGIALIAIINAVLCSGGSCSSVVFFGWLMPWWWHQHHYHPLRRPLPDQPIKTATKRCQTRSEPYRLRKRLTRKHVFLPISIFRRNVTHCISPYASLCVCMCMCRVCGPRGGGAVWDRDVF